MRSFIRTSVFAGVFCFSCTIANAQQAAIRFSCDGDSRSAQLFINGKHIGDCPMDQALPAGQMKIRAVKKWGDEQERVFELDTFLGPGGAKRVEVELGKPQFTAAVLAERQRRDEEKRRAELDRQRQMTLAQEEKKRAELEELRKRDELIARIKAEADAGNAMAMARYARRLELGNQVQRDRTAALHWYTKAAELGSGAAMAGLAVFRWQEGDPEGARAWAERGAQLGDGRALDLLAQMYLLGQAGLEKNPRISFELRQKAAAAGHRGAVLEMGKAYALVTADLSPFVHRDPKRGFDLIQQAAEPEDGFQVEAAAVSMLGYFYNEGIGIPADEKRAVALWRKAAELGSVTAQHELGVIHRDGTKGVAKDEREALGWFLLAAEKNYGPSIVNVGVFHELGRGGLPVSLNTAVDWYRRAAALNEPLGVENLKRFTR